MDGHQPDLRNRISGVKFTRDGRVVIEYPAIVENCYFEPVSIWSRIKSVFRPLPRLEGRDFDIQGGLRITGPGVTIAGPIQGMQTIGEKQ
jgi:hypothetical protein